MRIGIGIDTGGTCTDAVALDLDSGELIAKGKALTTREDLSIGISEALDALPLEAIQTASLISLSTTLATNACVENKGARAKLVIFGLNENYLDRLSGEVNDALKTDNVRCVNTLGTADGLATQEPDWPAILPDIKAWLEDADALAAAEIYSMNNGAVCEKHLANVAAEDFGIPYVSASELSSQINVLERGATALLNARLLPIVQEFVRAVLQDFTDRNCPAPIMIVRSDGSLMSADLSLSRPVETILSGPAASVLAGRNFTDEADYVIVDMGGTTTDVSVVTDHVPVMAASGIRIGGWQTHVKGVFVDTFALGGDSNVLIEEDVLRLKERRVVPLCVAATRWPDVVKPSLKKLLSSKRRSHFPLHEFFYLVHEPQDRSHYNQAELTLIDALRDGPIILDQVMDTVGVDLYNLRSERLEQEGIVMRAGLTPTDFMHLTGDYTAYDAEASYLGACSLLHNLWLPNTPENLQSLNDQVYDLVEARLYENLLRILITQQHPRKFAQLDSQINYLIQQSWQHHRADDARLFRYQLTTKAKLVGIGAPTHVFIPEVAAALGTEAIYPEHAEVANAIGALKADIQATVRVEISKVVSFESGVYYIVHAPNGSKRYDELDDALAAAEKASIIAAQAEARVRGALGELAVLTWSGANTVQGKDGSSVALSYAAESTASVRFEQ